MGIQIKVQQQAVTQDHTHLVNQHKRIPTRYDLAEQKKILFLIIIYFYQAKFGPASKFLIYKSAWLLLIG